MFAAENEDKGIFDSNIDALVSIDFANIQEPLTDETPSSVTSDEDMFDKKIESEEVDVEDTAVDTAGVEGKSNNIVQPKMVPYNEGALLKELSSSIKAKTGIEISVGENQGVDDFIDSLSKEALKKELSDSQGDLYGEFKKTLLEEQGIDEDVLAVATGIPYGIDRSEYTELMAIRDFSSQEIDIDDEESLKTLFMTYHSLKGLSDEDIEAYTESDLRNVNGGLVENRMSYLSSYASKGISKIQDTIKERKEAKSSFENKRNEDLRKVVNGFIKNSDFTKDQIDSYIKATTEKSAEIVLPDGVVKKVTAFEKKKYEFMTNSFEDAVKENISFWLESQGVKKEIQQDKNKAKVTGSFLNNYMEDINQRTEFTSDDDGSFDEDGFFKVQSKL